MGARRYVVRFSAGMTISLFIPLLLSACSMVGTRPAIAGPQGMARVACASSLPRALLTIDVKPGGSPSLELDIKRVPDNAHRYCLDYER